MTTTATSSSSSATSTSAISSRADTTTALACAVQQIRTPLDIMADGTELPDLPPSLDEQLASTLVRINVRDKKRKADRKRFQLQRLSPRRIQRRQHRDMHGHAEDTRAGIGSAAAVHRPSSGALRAMPTSKKRRRTGESYSEDNIDDGIMVYDEDDNEHDNDNDGDDDDDDDVDTVKRDPIIAMKDRVFYAKEEIAITIDIISRALNFLQPQQTQPLHAAGQPAPAANPVLGAVASSTAAPSAASPTPLPPPPPPPIQLLRVDKVQYSAPVTATSLIEAVHSALASKKEHLLDVANTRLKGSARELGAALDRERGFYDIALLLRRHGWILQAKDIGMGGGMMLYLDYGYRNAGSMFPEICEASFPWLPSSFKASSVNAFEINRDHNSTITASAPSANVATPRSDLDAADLDFPQKSLRRVRIWFGSHSSVAFNNSTDDRARADADDDSSDSEMNFEPWYVSARCRFAKSMPLLERLIRAQFSAFEGELFSEMCKEIAAGKDPMLRCASVLSRTITFDVLPVPIRITLESTSEKEFRHQKQRQQRQKNAVRRADPLLYGDENSIPLPRHHSLQSEERTEDVSLSQISTLSSYPTSSFSFSPRVLELIARMSLRRVQRQRRAQFTGALSLPVTGHGAGVGSGVLGSLARYVQTDSLRRQIDAVLSEEIAFARQYPQKQQLQFYHGKVQRRRYSIACRIGDAATTLTTSTTTTRVAWDVSVDWQKVLEVTLATLSSEPRIVLEIYAKDPTIATGTAVLQTSSTTARTLVVPDCNILREYVRRALDHSSII